MAIPISYNIRNLKLRKGLTVMTALGIALTVTTAIFLMALVAGLDRAFVSSGSPLNVLVLRKGSEAGSMPGALRTSPKCGATLIRWRQILTAKAALPPRTCGRPIRVQQKR